MVNGKNFTPSQIMTLSRKCIGFLVIAEHAAVRGNSLTYFMYLGVMYLDENYVFPNVVISIPAVLRRIFQLSRGVDINLV